MNVLSPHDTHALVMILTAPHCRRRHWPRTRAITGTAGRPIGAFLF